MKEQNRHKTSRDLAGWLLVAALCLTAPAMADVYQWTDAKGHIHFTDAPPRLLSPYRLGELQRPSARARQVKTVQTPAPRPPSIEDLRRHLHDALQRQRLMSRPREREKLLQARLAMPESTELCGLYRVSTAQYSARLQGCEGKACEAYTRQLRKFREKTRRFCGDQGS